MAPPTDTKGRHAGPFAATAEGLTIFIRLTPGASRDRLESPVTLADGRLALQARVCAPPQAGRANAALIKLLAKSLRLSKSRITLLSGQKDRSKTLLVAGDGRALLAQCQAWLAALGPATRS